MIYLEGRANIICPIHGGVKDASRTVSIQVGSRSNVWIHLYMIITSKLIHRRPQEIKITTMLLMLKDKAHHHDVLPTTMAQRRGNPEAQQPSADFLRSSCRNHKSSQFKAEGGKGDAQFSNLKGSYQDKREFSKETRYSKRTYHCLPKIA